MESRRSKSWWNWVVRRVVVPALVSLIASLNASASQPEPLPRAWPLVAFPPLVFVETPPLPTSLKQNRTTKTEDLPFWRRKPELMKKIRDDRAVVVSVRREDVAGSDEVRFIMQGVGMVNRKKDVAFKIAQNYPRLKDVSDNFKTVTYDPKTRQLFLITEALGYQARMILQVAPVSEDWRSELQWEVVWGHFKGMTGFIGFEAMPNGQTEVAISGRYQAKELPLPKFLMGFALEVVTQKVAEKMRTFLENQSSEELPSPTENAPLLRVPAVAPVSPATTRGG